MKQWPHGTRIGLVVVVMVLGNMAACSKDQESASHAAADRGPTPAVFTPRSHTVVEEPAPHPAPTVAREQLGAVEQSEPAAVSLSAGAEPTSGGAPLTVTFSAQVTGGLPDLNYRWDFGDGSAPTGRLNVQHTYTSAGAYTATFTATGSGVNESKEVAIEVTEEGFDLDINADPDIGTAPLTVELAGVFDDELPAPLSFQWDFGDGSRDVNNPTRHTYRLPGQYTVTLLVTNGLGQIARRDLEIQVDPRDQGQ